MKPRLALPEGGWRANADKFLHVGPPHDRLYKQGKCRVCEVPLFGYEPAERDLCGEDHCHVEARRKTPCKFKRLRNTKIP